MYIKSFRINIDRSKRLWAIILIALIVALTLIITSFFFVFKNSDNNDSNKYSKRQLFEAKSFYAEYDLNVFSNKNQNKYKMKEWYLKENENNYKFRIESDTEDNKLAYFGTKDTLTIKSDNQLSNINLNNIINSKENTLSIATFIALFNEINTSIENKEYNENKCCKIEEVENDDSISYIISLNIVNGTKENTCKICEKFLKNGMKISKFELIFDKEKMIPKEYIVYNANGDTYIDILYYNFVINNDFDEKLFAF